MSTLFKVLLTKKAFRLGLSLFVSTKISGEVGNTNSSISAPTVPLFLIDLNTAGRSLVFELILAGASQTHDSHARTVKDGPKGEEERELVAPIVDLVLGTDKGEV